MLVGDILTCFLLSALILDVNALVSQKLRELGVPVSSSHDSRPVRVPQDLRFQRIVQCIMESILLEKWANILVSALALGTSTFFDGLYNFIQD
jgi:hypothetical protein